MKGDSERASLLFTTDATTDAPAQRAPVDCEVSTNGRGINEPYRLVVISFDGRKTRERALIIFVLELIEPQPAAKADWNGKIWLYGHVLPRLLMTKRK
jgi:hypothetical protein